MVVLDERGEAAVAQFLITGAVERKGAVDPGGCTIRANLGNDATLHPRAHAVAGKVVAAGEAGPQRQQKMDAVVGVGRGGHGAAQLQGEVNEGGGVVAQFTEQEVECLRAVVERA